jgi:integrase
MVIVPALAKAKEGYAPVVPRIIASHKAARPPHVSARVDQPRYVKSYHHPQADAPSSSYARPPKAHRQLRDYLHQVCHELGLSTRIVPHQFRHTYASEMLRAGVGLPALMNLLGHVDPEHDDALPGRDLD